MCYIKFAVSLIDKRCDKFTNQIIDSSGVSVLKDVPYNDLNTDCKLDIFRKEGNSKLPVIVNLHGGSFMASDKYFRRGYCTYLAKLGYAVLNLNYPLAPKVRYKEMIKLIYTVFEFIEKNSEVYKLDKSDVSVMGDSAGAYLAMALICLATNKKAVEDYGVKETSIKPSCAVLYSGVYNPAKLLSEQSFFGVQKTIGKAFFGCKKESDLVNSKVGYEINLLNYVSADFPPTFISHTMHDKMCPGQGVIAVETFKSLGIPIWEYKALRIPSGHDWQLSLVNKTSEAVRTATADFLKNISEGKVFNKYFET